MASCCSLSLHARMRIFSALIIVISIVNVIFVKYEENVHEVTDYKTIYREYYSSNQTKKDEYFRELQKLKLQETHFSSSVFNIIPCIILFVNNWKRICKRTTFCFLFMAGSFFLFSFPIFNIMFAWGIMSGQLYAYHLCIYVVYYYVTFLVYKAYKDVSRREKEEGENISIIRMECSEVPNTDVMTMETQFT